jgi:beta-lactamase class A
MHTDSPLRKIYIPIILICVFAVGIFIGLSFRSDKSLPSNKPLRTTTSEFPLVSRLLAGGDGEISKSFNDLRNQYSVYIRDAIDSKKISSASVYYRDLNGGQWTGYNENEKYSPASMYKVSIMIAFMKIAESKPSILSIR